MPSEILKFLSVRGEKGTKALYDTARCLHERKKAIKALYDFIGDLKKQRSKELTDKQTKALIKIAECLISSIKT